MIKYVFFDESSFFFSDPKIHEEKMWEISDQLIYLLF